MELQDKVVVVTGSSSGIGKAIAIAYAKAGANVIVNYRNNEQGGRDVLKQLLEIGGNHLLLQADVSNEDEVQKLFSSITDHYDKIDILVNNAGTANGEDFLETSLDSWKEQMTNNFYSCVLCSQEFVKLNKSDKEKRIINISSIYADGAQASLEIPQYGVTKAAINFLTQTLARQYGPNILVNAIAPGYVWTQPWEGISDAEKQRFENDTTIGRFIEPNEIADMVVTVTKSDAMTGQIVTVDGGFSLK
jgi:3-oxoacyl-[acyl-carrier protein] reductase